MTHPRLPRYIQHSLSALYPPPYTPYWRSTFPLFKLPPTTSSYLYPLKMRFTFLPVSPGIITFTYTIYHAPSSFAQDVLSLPLDVRYWTVRQSYEERGKKSEQIAATHLGGGGGLWWNVNPFVKNTKSVIRHKLARKIRSAFANALHEAGFDQDGLRIEKSDHNGSASTNDMSKGSGSFVLGNLTGTLRISATAQALDASNKDLQEVCGQAVGHLQSIRLHHQRGIIENRSRRNNRYQEQTWQEAKTTFLEAMESMQAQIVHPDPSQITDLRMIENTLESVLMLPEREDAEKSSGIIP